MDALAAAPGQGARILDARRSAAAINRGRPMDSGSRYLIMGLVLAVFLVLLAGLWNMLRGKSPNLSQTLMRWRVGLQFLAIVIMMVLVYLKYRS